MHAGCWSSMSPTSTGTVRTRVWLNIHPSTTPPSSSHSTRRSDDDESSAAPSTSTTERPDRHHNPSRTSFGTVQDEDLFDVAGVVQHAGGSQVGAGGEPVPQPPFDRPGAGGVFLTGGG